MSKPISVILMQTRSSRALNVGYLKKNKFIPCRLNLGVERQNHTLLATIDSLKLPTAQKILKKFKAREISTVSILREALACQLGFALSKAGVINHFGDCFIGATHVKEQGTIVTKYQYENAEGLCKGGLWVIADSICVGRNLGKTMQSLLSKYQPQEVLFICPMASQLGIKNISRIVEKYHIPLTFIVWGAVFGVDKDNLYDMPWGHQDTKPLDLRDQKTFIKMYGSNLCVGGDFGNDYYCPSAAEKLYREQLREHNITPNIPSVKEVLAIYKDEELLA